MLPEIAENALIVFMGMDPDTMRQYAHQHFPHIRYIDLEECYKLLSDENSDLTITDIEVFDFFLSWIHQRTAIGNPTIAGGNWLHRSQRKQLAEVASKNHVSLQLLLFTLKTKRASTSVKRFHAALQTLKQEGFKKIIALDHESQLNAPAFHRKPLAVNLRHLSGPFDIIGDVHGCFDELRQLLHQLGHTLTYEKAAWGIDHPQKRKLIFVGDLADRGPKSVDTLTFVMDLTLAHKAYAIKGNHDDKLFRYLKGNNIAAQHGLETTIVELEHQEKAFHQRLYHFLKNLPAHLVLDRGNLVVTHAAIHARYIGKEDPVIEQFCMYGPTTGKLDENGFPERLRWQEDYDGKAWVVYGHTPVLTAAWQGNTVNIDTGAVYGNGLTALRYPEWTTVFQPSFHTYAPSKRLEIKPSDLPAPDWNNMAIPAEGEGVALEGPDEHGIFIDPASVNNARVYFTNLALPLQALPYLPPSYPLTPVLASKEIGNPIPAIEKYAAAGVTALTAELQPAGQKCVILIVKDPHTAVVHFALKSFKGSILQPNGMPVFENDVLTDRCLDQLHHMLTAANWWELFRSNWFVFEAFIQHSGYTRIPLSYYRRHLLPWLKETQHLNDTLPHAQAKGEAFENLKTYWSERVTWDDDYNTCYEQFNQPCTKLLAPVIWPSVLVASSTQVFLGQPVNWHFKTLQTLVNKAPELLLSVPQFQIQVAQETDWEMAENHWRSLDPNTWEGIVIKPARNANHKLLPGLLCRAHPLHLLYLGPSMLAPEWSKSNTNFRLGTKSRWSEEQNWLGKALLNHWTTGSPETYKYLLALLSYKIQWPDH